MYVYLYVCIFICICIYIYIKYLQVHKSKFNEKNVKCLRLLNKKTYLYAGLDSKQQNF